MVNWCCSVLLVGLFGGGVDMVVMYWLLLCSKGVRIVLY